MQEFARDTLLERRHHSHDKTMLWDKLTLAQKFAASSLTQFGYDMAFIRFSRTGNLAVLICSGEAATITADGDIDTKPQIAIRA